MTSGTPGFIIQASSGEVVVIRHPRRVYNSRSAAPVFHFERHEASDRDGEIKLSDNRLQIGQAAGERVDRHDVAVAGRGQGRQAEVEHRGEFVRAPVGAARVAKAAGLSFQNRLKAEAQITATFRYSTTAP